MRDGAADHSYVAVSDCLTIQGPHLSGVVGTGPAGDTQTKGLRQKLQTLAVRMQMCSNFQT